MSELKSIFARVHPDVEKRLKLKGVHLGLNKPAALVAAINDWLADSDENGKPIPKRFTIFRPLGTVHDDVTGNATDSEIEYGASGPVPPAQNEPDKLDPEVESWLAMLRYILTRGDADTKDAITKSLERFHLLTQILEPEVKSHERGGEVPKPPADQQARMDRVRELRKGHTGGGANPSSDEGRPRSDETPDSQSPGKRRKH